MRTTHEELTHFADSSKPSVRRKQQQLNAFSTPTNWDGIFGTTAFLHEFWGDFEISTGALGFSFTVKICNLRVRSKRSHAYESTSGQSVAPAKDTANRRRPLAGGPSQEFCESWRKVKNGYLIFLQPPSQLVW